MTARWAAWAEQVVVGWDESSAANVKWGVATIRAIGAPFDTASD